MQCYLRLWPNWGIFYVLTLSVLILCWHLTGFMNRADVCSVVQQCVGQVRFLLFPSVCELSKIPSLSLPPFSKGEKLLTFIVHHENSVFHDIQITLQLSNMREPGKHFNTWLKLVIDKWLVTQPFIHILLTFCSWNRSRPWESIVLVVLISCWKLYLQMK